MEPNIFIPYAVFCEECHQAEDGVVSLGRLIENLTCVEMENSPLEGDAELPPITIPYAVCFNSSNPIIELAVSLRCTEPSGDQFMIGSKTLNLRGNYKATFLSGSVEIVPRAEGLYIFEVLVGETVKTKMVLNISINRKIKAISSSDLRENIINTSAKRNTHIQSVMLEI